MLRPVVLCCAVLLQSGAAVADERRLDWDAFASAVTQAYPDFIASAEDGLINWRDNSQTPVGVMRSIAGMPASIDNASIAEQFYHPYPVDQAHDPGVRRLDAGRYRNQPFFQKLYGDCRRGARQLKLRTIVWLPRTARQLLQVTTVNGIDRALEKVSAEIQALPAIERRTVTRLSGGYACRTIAGTTQMSMHSFGAAMDLSSVAGGYWRWGGLARANRPRKIPAGIIEIFERHGFIWGGYWHHYDEIHFEYRPELILYAKIIAKRQLEAAPEP